MFPFFRLIGLSKLICGAVDFLHLAFGELVHHLAERLPFKRYEPVRVEPFKRAPLREDFSGSMEPDEPIDF